MKNSFIFLSAALLIATSLNAGCPGGRCGRNAINANEANQNRFYQGPGQDQGPSYYNQGMGGYNQGMGGDFSGDDNRNWSTTPMMDQGQGSWDGQSQGSFYSSEQMNPMNPSFQGPSTWDSNPGMGPMNR